MAAAVGDHGIAKSELAIKVTKQQTKRTIEKEATENNHGGSADHHDGGGQVAGGKQHSADHIGGDKCRNAFFAE